MKNTIYKETLLVNRSTGVSRACGIITSEGIKSVYAVQMHSGIVQMVECSIDMCAQLISIASRGNASFTFHVSDIAEILNAIACSHSTNIYFPISEEKLRNIFYCIASGLNSIVLNE